MFQKILIANRGEIAVRIARTCREMGIRTVALYEAIDETSLHIRLADECVLLESPRGFNDQEKILDIARAKNADALHPGYGFLAENLDFARACHTAGIALIAPPLEVLEHALSKIETLERARDAGFNAVQHSRRCADERTLDILHADAARLGYPVVVKSCLGGRGRGARLVQTPQEFDAAVQQAQREAQSVYGANPVYLEKAILPAHQIGVQILADELGNVIHLGEREGSLLHGRQKVLEESPAPCLNETQRATLWTTALALARALQIRGAVTLEFLADADGALYFSEIKPRIQIEHPLTEMRARLDLVREQIRLAAGEPLAMTQAEVSLQGWAIACRINAHDPQQNFLPSPGRVRVRFPNGPETRTDTYVYSGCLVPAAYDPLIAKITVWGLDRATALTRMERALREITFHDIVTNVPWLEQAVQHPDIQRGVYSTATHIPNEIENSMALRDLAIASALLYVRANERAQPSVSERMTSEWHRAARALPE